ncbi:MAG: hypothetical protein IPG89_20220 [Bacteroidetes bacterium]|nr:hypothetical protein [Bacteroidota bacterium]
MLILAACEGNRLDVDTSEVAIKPIKVLRLDKDIFAMDTTKIASYSPEMLKKYGNFYSTFIFGILNPGDVKDSAYRAISAFIQHPDMKEMNKNVNDIYNEDEIARIESELTTSFTYFNYHFPKNPLPQKVVAFQSGFNYNITTSDSTLGIGLEMYLGGNNKFYKMLQWPNYKVNQLSKEYLVSDAMKGWIINSFDNNEPVNNLLSHMIFYGKLYYCMDAVLPNTPDSIKIGYTSEQAAYCTKFEKKLWAYFTEKDRLYKNDLKEIAEYTAEGPFTSAISKECPPRIAMWIGWQIVRSYMNKNEKVSLQELMKTSDAQIILSKAKYKP